MNDLISNELDLQSLALAVARNRVGPDHPISQVLAREGYTQAQYDEISKDTLFNNMVEAYEIELIEKGFSFMAKNKVAAEDGIRDMYRLLKDPDTPAAVKVKIYENFVSNAGLAQKNTAANPANGEQSAGITINISAPPGYTAAIEKSVGGTATAIPAIDVDFTVEADLVANSEDDEGYTGEQLALFEGYIDGE